MTSKLRIESPEAMRHVMNRWDQNEPPRPLRKLRRSCPCVNSGNLQEAEDAGGKNCGGGQRGAFGRIQVEQFHSV